MIRFGRDKLNRTAGWYLNELKNKRQERMPSVSSYVNRGNIIALFFFFYISFSSAVRYRLYIGRLFVRAERAIIFIVFLLAPTTLIRKTLNSFIHIKKKIITKRRLSNALAYMRVIHTLCIYIFMNSYIIRIFLCRRSVCAGIVERIANDKLITVVIMICAGVWEANIENFSTRKT